MKYLISCVNTPISLIGYDWDAKKVFWSCPSALIRACGICYHHGHLVIGADRTIAFVNEERLTHIDLPGPFGNAAHSVHSIDENVGIVDTGNSRLLVYSVDGKLVANYDPLAAWRNGVGLDYDTIHLNDFTVTPQGLIASCFDYRPWRGVQRNLTWDEWSLGGFGLLLNLTGDDQKGRGRVVGCGFNHPHSLNYSSGYIYLCSSATGTFHVCQFTQQDRIVPIADYKIAQAHFLRGACRHETGWLLGGSAARHGERCADTMKIFYLNFFDTGTTEQPAVTEEVDLKQYGEIYDIIPWDDSIMQGVTQRLKSRR